MDRPKTGLRERGIYKLPDGRELIVCASGAGFSLYNPQAWKMCGLADYRAHADGRILSKGTPTRWRVEDLTDTGRTADYGSPGGSAA